MTMTNDRPEFSSEGAPDIGKTVNVKQKLMSGHETQMGLDTRRTDRLVVGRNVTLTLNLRASSKFTELN
jgi:hypothetical protein